MRGKFSIDKTFQFEGVSGQQCLWPHNKVEFECFPLDLFLSFHDPEIIEAGLFLLNKRLFLILSINLSPFTNLTITKEENPGNDTHLHNLVLRPSERV